MGSGVAGFFFLGGGKWVGCDSCLESVKLLVGGHCERRQ